MSKEEKKQPAKDEGKQKQKFTSSLSFGKAVGKIVKAPKMPKEKKE